MSWTLTVTDLNEYVRRSLAADPMLKDVRLRGEISNFKRHVTGHLYFSLKDENARIQCVMFRQDAQALSFEPRDGDKVELLGSVSLYTAAGSYQFYAKGMVSSGLGDLYRRFEELRRRLMAEGLFDAGRKRPLPLRPGAIGVVTALTGAVIHDIMNVSRRRDPGVQLILRPSLVQGEGAAQDLIAGIRELVLSGAVDVIIIGRGGGSLEDLWAFNEEPLVRAVAACPIPVISAVGHETDVTLTDFAADVRAATPSQAAELAVPDREALMSRLSALATRAQKAAAYRLHSLDAALATVEKRLERLHPLAKLRPLMGRTQLLETRLLTAAQASLRLKETRLGQLDAKLRVMSPGRVLERGYLIARDPDGRVIKRTDDLTENFELLLSDGRALARTVNTEKGDPFGHRKDL